MSTQNYRKHARTIPLWHWIVPLLLLALLIGSIINLARAGSQERYSAALILLISALLPVFYWYTRWFALRAQDRAIRAEENFRHFLLTGKPLPGALRMDQVIGLRFAADAEFPSLAQKALEGKLTQKQIKREIRNWRPDFNRV